MKILMLLLFLVSPAYAVQDDFSVQQQIAVTATTVSTLALAANPFRKYLLVQNNGSASVTLKFGSAQTGSEGVVIVAAGNYEPVKASRDAIYLKASTSTQTCVLVEGQ